MKTENDQIYNDPTYLVIPAQAGIQKNRWGRKEKKKYVELHWNMDTCLREYDE